MTTHRITALASIHDVEPGRLDRVLDIVDLMESARLPPGILLVVPDSGWRAAGLDRLRELVARGWMLAGHGWRHRARRPRGLYHRIHGAILSRDQAEHLSRTRHELVDMLIRCHAWFPEVDLPTPELYVPPAWAMGALRAANLRRLPFVWYETLWGIVRPSAGRRAVLPLVGYEADTLSRELGLRTWNRVNVAAARLLGAPLRVAIHPDDLHLRLHDALRSTIRSGVRFVEPRPWLTARLPAATPVAPPDHPSSASTASTTSPVPPSETHRT